MNQKIREIVLDVLSQQSGDVRQWKQAEHGCAIAKAAYAFALEYADADVEARKAITWKDFLRAYGEDGFAGGNLSQFQQALDGLPKDDECRLERPTKEKKAKALDVALSRYA